MASLVCFGFGACSFWCLTDPKVPRGLLGRSVLMSAVAEAMAAVAVAPASAGLTARRLAWRMEWLSGGLGSSIERGRPGVRRPRDASRVGLISSPRSPSCAVIRVLLGGRSRA